jgi:hypothetical protein
MPIKTPRNAPKYNPLRVICPKWTRDDLDGKTVEFRLPLADGVVKEGIGKFSASRPNFAPKESELVLEIQVNERVGLNVNSKRFSLPQSAADRIERHPDPKVTDFRCLGDGLLLSVPCISLNAESPEL